MQMPTLINGLLHVIILYCDNYNLRYVNHFYKSQFDKIHPRQVKRNSSGNLGQSLFHSHNIINSNSTPIDLRILYEYTNLYKLKEINTTTLQNYKDKFVYNPDVKISHYSQYLRDFDIVNYKTRMNKTEQLQIQEFDVNYKNNSYHVSYSDNSTNAVFYVHKLLIITIEMDDTFSIKISVINGYDINMMYNILALTIMIIRLENSEFVKKYGSWFLYNKMLNKIKEKN
jgi:hypothetical protein